MLLGLLGATSAALAQPAADPTLDAIRKRVLAGDDAGALALLAALPAQSAGRSDLRYLSARLYERTGKLANALASLPSELGGLPDSVATDICTRRALWLARAGKCNEARPLLVSLQKGASDAELPLQAAECALAQSDIASALATLRDLTASSHSENHFAAHLLLARALRLSGDRTAAIRELRQLYIGRPAHPRISEVEAALRELGEPLALHDDERLDRAERWLDAVKPESALAELDQLRAPKSKTVRARALHLRGMALFRMRTRYAEAAKVLAQAAAISGDTQASDAYHAARALARADRDADSVKAYRAFAKRFPDSRFTSDALHDAAWLELRHDLPGGEPHMRAFLADADKRGDHDAAQSAVWELAFHAFEQKQPGQALPLFERYTTTSSSALIRARGFYWAGRSALLADKVELARKHFRQALTIEPLHWYALLARARLRELGDDPADPFDAADPQTAAANGAAQATATTADASGPVPDAHAAEHAASDASAQPASSTSPVLTRAPALPGAEPAAPDILAGSDASQRIAAASFSLPADVTFYARLGLLAEASAALRKQEEQLRGSAARDDTLPELIAAYHDLQEYARPLRLAEREHADTLHKCPQGPARVLWDALFPQPHAAQVQALTEQQHLPPDFVYAIMRRESGYDPTVVSSADAIGLLQLIEPTAKQLANALGISPWKRALLFQPEINLRLGSRYLADLLALYHGQAVPAIAAYNAGEHRVSSWLTRARKRNKLIEVDRFVEDIPIEQTRNYVRAVVANWARYRYMADPAKPWPIELPLTLTK